MLMAMLVSTFAASSVMLSTPARAAAVDQCAIFSPATITKLLNGQKPVGGVGAAIIRDIVKQLNEDIPIWETKKYLERPVLCDGDGPIAEFRRWCAQFYSPQANP